MPDYDTRIGRLHVRTVEVTFHTREWEQVQDLRRIMGENGKLASLTLVVGFLVFQQLHLRRQESEAAPNA